MAPGFLPCPGNKGGCHNYLQDCFSLGIFCSYFPWLITDSWAARWWWWWRSNIRWEAILVGLCCQKIHSLKTRSFFHLRSSPQVLFSYQRVLIEGLQSLFIFLLFALYKVLLFLLSTIPQNVQCVCPKPTFFFSTLAVGFGFDRVGWFYGPLKFPAQVVSSTRWQKQISFEDT